jgi:hypothetical protein
MSEDIRRGGAVRRVTIDGFEVEATLTYEPVHEAEATEHPIIQGASPSDHIRKKPVTLQLEGVQSATPIDSVLRAETAEKQASRPREAYEFLQGLFGRLVTVSTDLGDYTNMTLLRLSAPRDVKTGEVLRFAVMFRQIRVVSNLTVDEPTLLLSKKSIRDLGKKNTTPTPEATKAKSIAAKAADSEIAQSAKAFLKSVGLVN